MVLTTTTTWMTVAPSQAEIASDGTPGGVAVVRFL